MHAAVMNVFRSVQDRGFKETSAAVGRVQELPGDELRQTIALHSSVLQERNHSQDVDITKTRLSVLSVLSVTMTHSCRGMWTSN